MATGNETYIKSQTKKKKKKKERKKEEKKKEKGGKRKTERKKEKIQNVRTLVEETDKMTLSFRLLKNKLSHGKIGSEQIPLVKNFQLRVILKGMNSLV